VDYIMANLGLPTCLHWTGVSPEGKIRQFFGAHSKNSSTIELARQGLEAPMPSCRLGKRDN